MNIGIGEHIMKVKNWVIGGIVALFLLLLVICGYRAYMFGDVTLSLEQMAKKRILITYYTRTNDTTKIANTIHELVGGDMIKIEPERAYPADKNLYLKKISEEKDKHSVVPLKNAFPKLGQYDIIFVGSPAPNGTAATPVKSFLYKNNKSLKKKIIIPFIVYEKPALAMGAYRHMEFQSVDSYFKNPYYMQEGDKKSRKVSITRWLKLIKFKRYELK